MINSKPNNKNYHNGNFIPINKNKVIKLNNDGGIYYRSSLEYKVLLYLDKMDSIIRYGCEFIEIDYILKDKDGLGSKHRYYPDVYYELQCQDGSVRRILMEIKPHDQVHTPNIKEDKLNTQKRLKNAKYTIDEWNKNLCKWEAAILYCEKKGFEFKILHEKEINRLFGFKK